MKFPFYKQLDAMDCGPTCLRMIAKYYGKTYSAQILRERSYADREGVSLLGTSDAAESIGMRTQGVHITYEQLEKDAPLPCIVHWNQKHFVVVFKIKGEKVHVADPAHGIIRYTKREFLKGWAAMERDGEKQGICLLLDPSADFYVAEDERIDKGKIGFLFSYLRPYRKLAFQLLLGMLLGSVLQLMFPFLTQSIVDFGITNQNLDFITLVLVAQLILFVSRMSVDIVRSWLMLHISTRVNISLISDFLIKLMKLPVGFFDTKMIGDLMQRIGDHTRIEAFLTSTTLNVVFSLINLVVFSIIMAIYSMNIFFIFIVASVIYVSWVLLFMKKRREVDFKRFAQLSANQSNLIQLITGMQEIKLNNCEKQKRWQWERIQARLFKINIQGMSLTQFQQAGGVFVNEVKNILITFTAATAVINGQMTLGMMLAVQYILGQMNSPLEQLTGFIQQAQDAKISFERLGEIHNRADEEPVDEPRVTILPQHKSISARGLSFQYGGPHSDMVLSDLDFDIPEHRVTAIVGASGSGKTTLIKLLLGFYPPTKGEIRVGEVRLGSLSGHMWRENCGVVMQDGFIFSDTIARNIAVSDENVDTTKLLHAVRVANIQEFVESLPLAYNTKIGIEGVGISQGQRQRILIARAVYKNPKFIYFDEATNALDAENERVIMGNLERFFEGKTVIVVAHRLSTVVNADQIIVLDRGKIIERGTHRELAENKFAYYNLVRNQLELGG